MKKLPLMTYNDKGVERKPTKVFQVNDSTLIAVYKGRLSKYDILIKYRQKLNDDKWSRIRTPKHIHWTVDVLMKMEGYPKLTREFVKFFIDVWEKTKPLKNESQRQELNLKSLLEISSLEIKKFKDLSKRGEYSVRFLILLAKLLMLQEKTNRADAYMFKRVLEQLKKGKDLFRILATATLAKR